MLIEEIFFFSSGLKSVSFFQTLKEEIVITKKKKKTLQHKRQNENKMDRTFSLRTVEIKKKKKTSL